MKPEVVLLLLLFIAKATTLDLEVSDIDGITYSSNGNVYIITMREEMDVPILLAHFNYAGSNNPGLTFFSPDPNSNSYLGLTLDKSPTEDRWSMSITLRQDYESTYFDSSVAYFFSLTAGAERVDVQLVLENINDNRPIPQVDNPTCRMEEHNMSASDCIFTITDADGHMTDMTWTFGENDQDFELLYTPVTDNNTKEMTLSLRPVKELDYEQTVLYIMDWTVYDTPIIPSDESLNGTMKIVVEVVDIADTDPIWLRIFASAQFDELTYQEFQVQARDGDLGINDVIFYTKGGEWDEYISVDRTTGVITVQPISRDELQREIFTFEISACEENMPEACTSQEITFFVIDINNQIPQITVTSPTSIEIDENFYDDLGFQIYVNDLDTGENAMYSISLTSSGNYHDAFTVAPATGYQNTNIFLYVTNYRLLDYDRDESWREFSLTLTTEDRTPPHNSDTAEFIIRLRNLNDEIPTFIDTEDGGYFADIEETVSINEFVIAVLAEDADFEDKVRYSLLGTYINSILSIDEETGIITTKINGAFDYETQEEVIFQVQAIDSLAEPYNTAIAQITINVIDINDETPVISISADRIEVEENREDGTVIVNDTSDFIIATDNDQYAVLDFDIDWDNSYATKTGRRISDDEFNPFKNCIIIEPKEIPSTGNQKAKSARAILTINEVVDQNTPDYEIFDVLYLRVIARDTNQTVNENEAAVTVPIYILNINDAKPVFQLNTITSTKHVMENSVINTTIAIIIATDEDSDTIFYYLHSENHTGLVDISDLGELYVTGNIDADDPPLFKMVFSVTASDGEFNTTEKIVIEVGDLNDNSPQFTFPLEDSDFPIDEKAIQYTPIMKFEVEDKDRDKPNNVVEVRFSNSLSSNLRFYFSVTDTHVIVDYLDPDDKLDRDNAVPGIVNTIRLMAVDGSLNDPKTTEVVFTVTLQDINDQFPIITTLNFEVSESYTMDDTIGTLIAEDKDEPNTPNSKIDFEIIRIEAENGIEMSNDMFHLYNINNVDGTAELRTGINLESHHGTYLITIQTTDFGEDPLQYNNTVTVVVHKYNFKNSKFMPPIDGSKKLLLRKPSEPVTGQLYWHNDRLLEDIVATDQQNDKYNILFSIVTNTDDNAFQIIQIGDRTARLELTANANNFNDIYIIILRAQAIDGTPELPTDISLTIQFVNSTAEPTFDVTTESLTFVENTTGLTDTFRKAAFSGIPDELIDEYTVFYIINVNPNFEIKNNTVNEISPIQILDREVEDSYTVQIQASRSPEGVASPQEESVLILSITVQDINDNPPNFESSIYYGTVLSSTAIGTSILTVHATDLDIDDTLTYSIGSYDNIPANINNNNPCSVGPLNGQISINIEVPDTADGFFSFSVEVTDGLHEDYSNVEIYIVSELHRVEFVFRNNYDTVHTVSSQIITVLVDQFGFRCIIEAIARNTGDDGNALEDEVIVRVHFIDPQTNVPIYKTTIESLANNIQVFSNLMSEFLRYDLVLLRFMQASSTPDNMEEVLRAWLIGISIVLGTLCVLLLVAFILKTRSLTKRLNKLSVIRYGSQESGLNRKAAPTTNKHAIEGSNPAYSEEKIKAPENDDAMSVGSGDSDLYGVENNPEFDYKYEKKNGNVIM